MASTQNLNESWLQNKDSSIISDNIKKNLKHGRSNKKYNFHYDPTDVIDQNVQEYSGIDNIKILLAYVDERNLGKVEFTVFQCKSQANMPAYYANIKLGMSSLASSFPEKYSLPEIAKQVAARNALGILKQRYDNTDIPVTKEMSIVIERLEIELKKNYAGLFCDKVEDIYKEVYHECLPDNWLNRLRNLKKDILVEELPKQEKAILYYSPHNNNVPSEVGPTASERNAPIIKFVNKAEKHVVVTCIDSNQRVWIRFNHDTINNQVNALSSTMNMPGESRSFIKISKVDLNEVYAVQFEGKWQRYQVNKIEDNITGIFIDLGIEYNCSNENIMFLPQKFLSVPSQAVGCALTNMFFAPYFPTGMRILQSMLLGREFIAKPDNIESDIQMITLYNGKTNINNNIMEVFVNKCIFNKIDESKCQAHLSFVADGYMYLHPVNETLLVLESVLDSISESRPLEKFYSKKSISPNKVYLVKCLELDTWSRAIISDFIFIDQQFKVYFIDYGNCSLIDQDKFIPLDTLDPMLAAIPPQALKVSFHLFPPEQFTESKSRALYEMAVEKLLDVVLISTNKDGVPIVEIFDAEEDHTTRISYNTQLYQSV
ncbi:uncharacterized protein LOC126834455 [Adelges cooleyi]|uniref:uncharacterized protein LOC126834455 n=1 Tax=Adelges cooleyi TaxID=133065 RepID=UPI0021807EA4|nr:uncharacterized protein LOC126834455 [Adelges cooleyi]